MIVLQLYRPPNEVGIYYAASKTMALVAFIYFSVAQTLAHKFAEYHVAGDRARLADFLAVAVRMTFWPSLGAILCSCSPSVSRSCACSATISSPAII